MKAIVTLMDTTTGEQRETTHEFKYGVENFLYWLLEGNAGCDCNRHMFFYPDKPSDQVCSDNRFKIIDIKLQINFVDRDFYSDEVSLELKQLKGEV